MSPSSGIHLFTLQLADTNVAHELLSTLVAHVCLSCAEQLSEYSADELGYSPFGPHTRAAQVLFAFLFSLAY